MSAPETRTIERCLACGDHHPFWRLAMRYEWQGAAFPLVQCSDCDLRFLRVQPVGETLARMYSAEYFQADFRCGRSDTRSDDEAAFREENDGLLDRFERYRGKGRLLEVGSAYGLLLARAAERGWTAAGVELSPDAVEHSRARGLDVRQGTLADAALPEASFDLVYMGDVLEHVPDCRDTLERVAALLAPGGHLFLRGPITTNSLARRLGLSLFGMAGRAIILREPPYHLWEFTPGSLRWLARAVGLQVIEMRQAKIPPGRVHGSKSALQRAAMGALDAVNAPITRAFNALGDRVVMIARKP
jgi:2-polyprenyl-3-methyl-5-hydroxy-6-metoxy-1,4-benzoquinol methylase